MKLRSSPKHFGDGTHRVVSPEETFARVLPVAETIGLTRLADITGLDRIGIPVYSAIVPKSNDVVSVYNGKGMLPIDAKVGAIMEAIERYAAWSVRGPDVIGSYDALRVQRCVLNPRDIVVSIQDDYTDATEIGWVEGFDLLQNEPILIPFYAAAYFRSTADYGHLCYSVTSTNGLASGNTAEEAICHALCEIIERDAWSLAELVSCAVPNAGAAANEQQVQDDLERYPCIDLASLSGRPRELLALYDRAGMKILLRDLTSDTGIATILCTVSDDLHDKLSPVHAGLGSHPDATVALTRAMTEAAQARAVDIQGLREDMSMADDVVDQAFLHSKRVTKVERSTFYQSESINKRSFADISSQKNHDILDDINLMLNAVRKAGCTRAVVVDFTLPEIEASVFRVVVPGMESWAALKGRIGERALTAMRKATLERKMAAVAHTNSQRIMDALFGSISRS
jgi:ribosomal protein S12 methylthiotransferase accessory factor